MEPRSEYLSASRIKTLNQCPMKFYLSYVAPYTVEMPKSWGAANGTLLHEVFEEYASGENRDWRNNLMTKFRNAMTDQKVLNSVFKFYKGQKITVAEAIKDSKRSCGKCPFGNLMSDGQSIFCKAAGMTTNEFQGTPRAMLEDTIKLAEVIFDPDFNPIDEMKVLGVEHEFDVTFENGVRTYGFIDLVSEVNDETIEIRDYKSAKKTPTTKDIDKGWINRDVQMELYFCIARYCCKNNIPPFSNKYKNIFITIHFLRSGPITMVYNESDYYRILRNLKDSYDLIRTIEKPLPKGMWGYDKNWVCSYCNKDACEKACQEIHGKSRQEICDENKE